MILERRKRGQKKDKMIEKRVSDPARKGAMAGDGLEQEYGGKGNRAVWYYIGATSAIGILLILISGLVFAFQERLNHLLLGFSQDGSLKPVTMEAIHVFPYVVLGASLVILLPSLALFLVVLSSNRRVSFLDEANLPRWAKRFRSPSRTAKVTAVVLFIFLLNFLMFHFSIDDFFGTDDFLYLEGTQDAYESHGGILRAFTDEGIIDRHYRPLSTVVYFTVMHDLFGLDPSGYHIMNILVQCLNAVLIFFLIKKVTTRYLYGLFGSIFYSTRGALYVSVFWITDMTDLLLTCFFLLTILNYLTWRSGKKYVSCFLSVLCYAGALLSKESAITLPAVLVVLELFVNRINIRDRGFFRNMIRNLLPFVLTTVLFFLFRYVADIPFATGPYTIHPGAYTLLRIPVYFLWSLFALSELSFALLPIGILGWIVIGMCLFLWVKKNSKNGNDWKQNLLGKLMDARHSLIGILWFLLTLAPTLFMPERFCPYYLTLPLSGLSLTVGIFLGNLYVRFKGRRFIATCFMVSLIVTFVGLSGIEIFAKSKRWIGTGGYIDGESPRIAERALADMKRLFPTLPEHSELFIFNFHEDATLGGNPQGTGYGECVAFASMFRVFYGLRHLTLTYVDESEPPDVFIKNYLQENQDKSGEKHVFFVCFDDGHFRVCPLP